MRKLIAITQLSLNGVMQDPGGPEEDPADGFTQGWFMGYGDEALMQAIGAIMAGDFDLLLGATLRHLDRLLAQPAGQRSHRQGLQQGGQIGRPPWRGTGNRSR
jgi:hypothetical protein